MRHALVLSLIVLLSSCARDPLELWEHTSPPEGLSELLSLIDLESSGFELVKVALSEGDSLAATELMHAYFRTHPPIEAPHSTYSNMLNLAEDLLDGTLELPNHPPFDLPDDPDWSEDPFGDPNWRFLYHTFRWPMSLLEAYRETGEQRFLDRFLFLMEDYAQDNIGGISPSDMTWYDMAASIRIENWLYSWKILLETGDADEAFMIRFLPYAWYHGEMLANGIEYAEEGNHGTFHSRALLSLGLVFPQFNDASGWYDLGSDRLETQLLDLVSDEGVHLEQAVFYHFYMMTAYQEIRELLQSGGMDFSAEGVARIEKMPLFAAHILQPNGWMPMLSDTPQDLRIAIPEEMHPWLDFSLSQGERGERPTQTHQSYDHSGYVIFRSGWGEARNFTDETQLVFDTGPKGSGHGHFDAQTFVLSAFGTDMLVDSGYYTFVRPWREYFRSPSAHNILLPVDDPPAEWETVPERLIWRRGEDWALQSSRVMLPDGRFWRRAVVHLAPDDFIILDDVEGAGEELELLFHLAPGASLDGDGRAIHLEFHYAKLDILSAGEVGMSTVSGATDPTQGWYSPKYGVKEPNTVLSLRSSAGPRFQTLLHPHRLDPVESFELLEDDTGRYRFRIVGQTGVEEVEIDLTDGSVIRSY